MLFPLCICHVYLFSFSEYSRHCLYKQHGLKKNTLSFFHMGPVRGDSQLSSGLLRSYSLVRKQAIYVFIIHPSLNCIILTIFSFNFKVLIIYILKFFQIH
jgi:hypothetical protein